MMQTTYMYTPWSLRTRQIWLHNDVVRGDFLQPPHSIPLKHSMSGYKNSFLKYYLLTTHMSQARNPKINVKINIWYKNWQSKCKSHCKSWNVRFCHLYRNYFQLNLHSFLNKLRFMHIMLQNSNASLSLLDICHEPRCCPCDLYLSLKEKTRTHLYIYICIDQTESIIWILIKRIKN